MKVTVALGSGRPGGLDVSMRGLCEQTYGDFEVVFVDGRYHQRHERVLDYVRSTGFTRPFFHVPNHRYQPLWPTICAGFNTGFMLADGEVVVMLLDYAYARPDWLEKHVAAHEAGAGRLVMAPHAYHDLPNVLTLDGELPLAKGQAPGMTPEAVMAQRERYGEVCSFYGLFTPSMMGPRWEPARCDAKLTMPEGPCSPELFHTKNESFSTSAVLEVNGMDERYDCGAGPGDPELALRLTRAGLSPWLTHAAVECVNPRDVLPNPNVTMGGVADRMAAHPQRRSYQEGHDYYEATKRDPRVVRARGNPYDLVERKKEIWRWREMSQERTAVIPRNEVLDEEYFRGAA